MTKFFEKKNYYGNADRSISPKLLKKYKKELKENGFDSTELWNLDYTIAKFILPRLIAYMEDNVAGYPSSFENAQQWQKTLLKMIKAFELIIQKNEGELLTAKEEKKIAKGLKLFAKNLQNLWI